MKKELKIISISIIALISAVFFIIGNYNFNFNMILIGILFMWVANLIFGLCNIKKNLNMVLYCCTFFTLLLGQKITYMLQGVQWWKNFSIDIYQETLFILYIALSSILLGSIISNAYKTLKKSDITIEKQNFNYYIKRKEIIRKVSKYIFILTLALEAILVLEKILYVQQNSYLALYTGFKTIFPSFIKKIADLHFIFLTMYLFTFPKKKEMLKIITVYVIFLILTIFTGSRGEFVTKILMILIYFAYRQFILKNERYYTKKNIMVISCLGVVLIAFLGMYNYIRNDQPIKEFSLCKSLLQFFLDQGTSVDVISNVVVYKEELGQRNQNYTFGYFFNRFYSLKGVEQPTELKEIALKGNNLGAAISDLVLKERYLNGEGLGTQYIAELYVDYGYIGVIIYNVILGIVLTVTSNIKENKWLKNSIKYLVFNKIIYLPRQFASDWIIIFISSSYILSFLLVFGITEIIYVKNRGKRKKGV